MNFLNKSNFKQIMNACIKEPCSQTDDYRENEADKHTAKGDHQKRCHTRQIVERFQIIFTNVCEHHKHFVEDLCNRNN